MNLLERYLNQIGKYLPLKDREDTLEELKNLLLEEIESRISEGQNQDDAEYEVIKSFGSPKEVALKYRNDDPIISREMEPILYLVLKIVISAVPFSILLASIIGFLNNGNPFNFIDFLLNIFYTLPEMFSGALAGVGMTFIIFVLIERYAKPYFLEELEKENALEFNPKHLPKIPDSIFKVSLLESLLAIAFGMVFLYILNYQQGLIGIYLDGETVPLLNDGFAKILPLMNISIVFGVFIGIIHIIVKKKTLITATLEFMNKIITTVIFILIATGDIINQDIIEPFGLEVLVVLLVVGASIGATANIIGGLFVYIKILIAKSGKEELIKDIIKKQ